MSNDIMAVLTNSVFRNMKAQSLTLGGQRSYSHANNTILVYSGIMPELVPGATLNLATYAPQLLVGFNSYSLGPIRAANYISFAISPAASTASVTGTAGWVAVITGQSSYTAGIAYAYILGEPSLTNDDGIIQLSTLSITAGQSVSAISLYLAY